MSSFNECVDRMCVTFSESPQAEDLLQSIEEAIEAYRTHGPHGDIAEAACIEIAWLAHKLWEGDF